MVDQNARSQVIYWLTSGCFLVFCMVLIGGITRLTGSGLSIVEWDVIMGTIPPLSEAEWQASFEAYKQFPEFQIQPLGFSLSDYKSIFWWEYIHRLLGRFIGLVFIIPFIYFVVTRKVTGRFVYQLLFLLFLGGLQGFIGWYMVKSGLVNKPHVSHLRLALHLITAFTTFAYTFWLILKILYPHRLENRYTMIRGFTIFFLITLAVQITYGAFVAGMKAGLFYNTFPKMGEKWIADGVFALEPFYRNFIDGIASVQFIHRYVAAFILVLEIVFFILALRAKPSAELRSAMKLGMLIVLIQETLGVLTLLFGVPLSLALLHQIGAFFLLAILIYILRLTSFTWSASSAVRI